MDIVVFVGLLVLILGAATPFLMLHQSRFSRDAILRRRVLALAPGGRAGAEGSDQSGRARQRLIQGKLKELEQQRAARRNTLGHLLKQSGLALTVPGYLGGCLGTALVTFLVLWSFAGLDPVIAAVGATGAGLGLPRLAVVQVIRRRQTKFTAHFAEALDILVRGARSGLPVGECLRIVGREVPDPVGFEFRMLVECQRVGMTTEQALSRGLERMPTAEFQFFAVVLVIQQQTGGNLAATLENLSNVLRSRKRVKDKIASMSSEAKSSAMIIGALPFLVAGLIWAVNPDYMSLLFTTRMGNMIIMAGLLWMAAGIFVMYQMIHFKF